MRVLGFVMTLFICGFGIITLKQKADNYDKWCEEHHIPYLGGIVNIDFTNPNRKKVLAYRDFGDSCMWTGVYLASQSLRYHLSGSEQALANAKKAALALDGFLHSTQTVGYIARFLAPQDSIIYRGDEWCAKESNCHKITSGKYAGKFWWGDTSKDQYIGWFFGLSMAFDYLDDAQIKAMISADVQEVVNKLIQDKWIIRDEKGEYPFFNAASRVSNTGKMAWLLIAHQVSKDKKYLEELESITGWWFFLKLEIEGFVLRSQQYSSYYPLNLDHTNYYSILKLSKEYLGTSLYKKMKYIFSKYGYRTTKLAHNPWFTGIHVVYRIENDMGLHTLQLKQDLQDFREAPSHRYHLDAKDPSTFEYDQHTSWLFFYETLQPYFEKLGMRPQASRAFPIKLQCNSDFLFQRNPYKVKECGSNRPECVYPGIDYLISYWIARHHKIISETD